MENLLSLMKERKELEELTKQLAEKKKELDNRMVKFLVENNLPQYFKLDWRKIISAAKNLTILDEMKKPEDAFPLDPEDFDKKTNIP